MAITCGAKLGRSRRPQRHVVTHITTIKRVDKSDIVVTSTLPIFGHLAINLFYFKLAHSISEGFVEQTQLELELLEYILTR